MVLVEGRSQKPIVFIFPPAAGPLTGFYPGYTGRWGPADPARHPHHPLRQHAQ